MDDILADIRQNVAIWRSKKALMSSIAQNIRDRRRELGITQYKMAELMDTKQPDIARMERQSHYSLTVSRLNKVAHHLKTTVSELTKITEVEPPKTQPKSKL